MKLDWSHFEDIGIDLYEKFPEQDPLKLRFTDLKTRIFDLENFEGDQSACNEQKLEAVQMAWWEEYQDNL
jgi:FeS assembly protein IscX